MRSTLTFSPKLVKGLAFPSPGNSPSSLLLRLPVCFPRKLREKNERGNAWILCGLFSYALGLPPMKESTQFC